LLKAAASVHEKIGFKCRARRNCATLLLEEALLSDLHAGLVARVGYDTLARSKRTGYFAASEIGHEVARRCGHSLTIEFLDRHRPSHIPDFLHIVLQGATKTIHLCARQTRTLFLLKIL
jgi:hypothetical protein